MFSLHKGCRLAPIHELKPGVLLNCGVQESFTVDDTIGAAQKLMSKHLRSGDALQFGSQAAILAYLYNVETTSENYSVREE